MMRMIVTKTNNQIAEELYKKYYSSRLRELHGDVYDDAFMDNIESVISGNLDVITHFTARVSFRMKTLKSSRRESISTTDNPIDISVDPEVDDFIEFQQMSFWKKQVLSVLPQLGMKQRNAIINNMNGINNNSDSNYKFAILKIRKLLNIVDYKKRQCVTMASIKSREYDRNKDKGLVKKTYRRVQEACVDELEKLTKTNEVLKRKDALILSERYGLSVNTIYKVFKKIKKQLGVNNGY